MNPKIELGRYRRIKDQRSVWVLEVIPREGKYPQLKIRRPRGAFYRTATITAQGFLARHEKVRDNGL